MGPPPLCLSLSARRRGDPADGGRAAHPLSRHPLSACQPQRAQAHEAPRQRGQGARPPEKLARHRARHCGAIELRRSEEHTSELQSLMRISYAVFCLKKKNKTTIKTKNQENTKTKYSTITITSK